MISSAVSPFATRPTTVATGIRVPATQGTPPMIWWSTVIRPRSMYSSWASGGPASNRPAPRRAVSGPVMSRLLERAGRARQMPSRVERCLSVLLPLCAGTRSVGCVVAGRYSSSARWLCLLASRHSRSPIPRPGCFDADQALRRRRIPVRYLVSYQLTHADGRSSLARRPGPVLAPSMQSVRPHERLSLHSQPACSAMEVCHSGWRRCRERRR